MKHYLVAGLLATTVLLSTGTSLAQSAITWDVVYANSGGPVAYANGQYVTFSGGTVIGSSTGAAGTWNPIGNTANLNIPYAATYGNGLFVLVGSSLGSDGDIATSRDGTNWTMVVSGLSNPLHGIIYAHNMFVAVGGDEFSTNSAIVLTSSDGVKWTRRNSGTASRLMSVAYGNGVFLAVGDRSDIPFTHGLIEGAAVLTSPDGATWTQQGNVLSNPMLGVAFGDGVFAELGDQSDIIFASANGYTFSASTLRHSTSALNSRFKNIAYGGGWFVAVGSSSTGILISTNGVTWIASDYPFNGTLPQFVSYVNGLYLVTSPAGILRGRTGVTLPPAITVAPQSQSVNAGDPVTLSVTASGTPPLTYQWWFDGAPLLSQTNVTINYSLALPDYAGNYTVVVNNPYGSVTSSPPANLTVIAPTLPKIISQPVSQGIRPGATAIFSVTALGAAPLTYQWSFNGTNLPGQMSPNLILSNATASQAGNYSVLVTSPTGSTDTQDAILSVGALPSTSTTQYWPMYDGDIRYFSGTNGLSYMRISYDSSASPPQYLVQFFGTDFSTNYYLKLGLEMSYSSDGGTLLDYTLQPPIGATFDLSPPWTWFDNTQLLNGGTISSSFVASVPNVTNINSSGAVSISSVQTVTVPAGMFSNCRSVSITGNGVIQSIGGQSLVLAPGIGPVKIGVYMDLGAGPTFIGWQSLTGGTVGGVRVGSLPAEPVNHTITLSASPNAAGTVNGGGTFAAGSSQTVTAEANSGYTFVNWTETGTVVSSAPSYTITVSGNVNLVANFTANPLTYAVTVTVSPTAGGTVSGWGTFASGSSQTVTATANSGYTFANWTENGTVVSSSAGYTFTLVSNLNLVANFAINSGNFTFTNNNNTITITGYTGPGGAVTIPSKIGGIPVTSIGTWAFGYSGLTGVTIPNTVTNLGRYAFYGCGGLTFIMIPNSATNIGEFALANCDELTSITVDPVNPAFDSLGGILFDKSHTTIVAYPAGLGGSYSIPDGVTSIGAGAFAWCNTNLISVTIPNSVTNIGDSAFTWCISLTNLPIPSSVTTIGGGAFQGCYNLAIVTIPASVTSIGNQAFSECGMSAITVNASNPSYSSLDGVLFDKNQSTLIQYPPGKAGKSYVIPYGVASIGDDAFIDTGLTNVVIPEGLASIGPTAFWSSSLISISIPSSVTTIGGGAFTYCGNLKTVYFAGNAPSPGLFYHDAAVIYYLPGTIGWSSTFDGLPTALWSLPYPLILTSGPGPGVQNNRFALNISWASNTSVIVEASTNLVNPFWQPLQTNALVGGFFYFTDPNWTNYSGRFYRVQKQ
jgi:hypothetical protein